MPVLDAKLDAALSALNRCIPIDEKQGLVVTKCRGLMRGYSRRWAETPYIVDEVESVVESELWNPESGRRSRTFRLAGKLDVTGWLNGRRVIIDHKTASDDIGDPNSPYWRQLIVEAQPSYYSLMEWLNGRKVDDVVWDVVKKPAIRPKEVAKKDQEATLRTGLYFGSGLSDDAKAYLRETGRENFEMYEARLAYDCAETRTEWYFQRRSILRLDSALSEYATDLWENAQEVLHSRNTGRHAKNHKACLYKNTPCKFLGICSGYDEPTSDNWEKKQQVHAELPTLSGDGRDVLTNSRMGEFMLCRQKHYLSYELGIERQDEEEAEALFFGSLWHSAQEAWWLALRDEQIQKGEVNDVHNDSGSPANGVGAAVTNDETSLYF
jgi:hypothetical protein